MKKIGKILLTTISLLLISSCAKNTSPYNGNDSYSYNADGSINYNYNIFSATQWNVSPYIYGGYMFQHSPLQQEEKMINYNKILSNFNHGWTIGGGIVINRNWSFGLSFSQTLNKKDVEGEYSKYLHSINTEILSTNLDIALRLPFVLNDNKLNFYIIGGLNIMILNIKNDYNSNVEFIPVALISEPLKTSFGANLGLSVKYTIFSGFYFGVDIRRLWVINKSSIIKNTWLLSGNIGFQF